MQVRSKDSKHLFSLDNLLDFLHKKADITDCLKQHHLLWRIHDTCFKMKNEVRKKKHMWRWDRYRNKDCEKETRQREKRGREYSVNLFLELKWKILHFLLVYWVHQWEMSTCNKPLPGGYQSHMTKNAQETFCWVLLVHFPGGGWWVFV